MMKWLPKPRTRSTTKQQRRLRQGLGDCCSTFHGDGLRLGVREVYDWDPMFLLHLQRSMYGYRCRGQSETLIRALEKDNAPSMRMVDGRKGGMSGQESLYQLARIVRTRSRSHYVS